MEAAQAYADGLAANASGRPRVALRCFMSALDICPDRPAWVISAANMHGKLGEDKEARVMYQRALLLDLTQQQREMVGHKLDELDTREANRVHRSSLDSLAQDNAQRAVQLYQEGKDADLAPNLRETKLQGALRLWNGMFHSGSLYAQASLHKNVASTHRLLAELCIVSEAGDREYRLSRERRHFHYLESLNELAAAYRDGETEGRADQWKDEVIARCSDVFAGLGALLCDATLEQRLLLRVIVLKLPAPLQLEAMARVVCSVFHHGLVSLDDGQYAAAYKAFREVERPLTEAEQLSRRASAPLRLVAELHELRDSVMQHLCISESRLAIEQGDTLINQALGGTESLDMELVWTALDKFQEAGVLTRGHDIESEAIASARRGKVYARVLRNESLSRPLLVQATRLAASLSPRTFFGVPWYDECVRQLQAYQDATANAETRAEDVRREKERRSQEPVRRKLKPELETLAEFADKNSAYKLLEHVYDKYEPKLQMFRKSRESIKKRIADASSDTIKR